MATTHVDTTTTPERPLCWLALDRHDDVTGISGTGIIAFLLVLDHGILSFWDTGWHTVSWYPDLATVLDVHGHDGRTVPVRIVAIDRPMRLFHHRIGDVMDTLGDALVALAATTAPAATAAAVGTDDGS